MALGTPLIEVGDTQRMEVVTELLTTDAWAARVGSRVVIERWGGPAVLEGRVRMDRNFALEKSELEAGFVLTCQAHPLTDRVVISFDER